MVDGPALQNTDELLNWFKKNEKNEKGKRRLFRIPVIIKFKDKSKLEIKECYLATSENIPQNALRLELDDSGLGLIS